MLTFNHAVVSRIPGSLFHEALAINDYKRHFDLSKARAEHARLVLALRLEGLDVIELAAVEATSMCCFVDETAFICDGIALMARLTVEKRQREVDAMAVVLRREGLDIRHCNQKFSTLSGGDVIFTGREIFVGLSKYTNLNGARAVATTFPDYPVTLIKVPKNHHLKYYVSLAGPECFVFGNSPSSRKIKEQMKYLAEYGKSYKAIVVSHDVHSGCLPVNSKLFHSSAEECSQCDNIIEEKLHAGEGFPLNNECAKIFRSISSRVLLFNLSSEKSRQKSLFDHDRLHDDD